MTGISIREITLYTPNKKYTGTIDLQNEGMRTIDLLNSSSIYWREPNEKSFNDSIQLFDVVIEVQGNKKLSRFHKLQLRLSDIIFFSDNLNLTGSLTEIKRAKTLYQKTSEKKSSVKIITRMRGDAFYIVKGVFYGLFKNKSQQRFFPLTNPQVREILRTGSEWQTRNIDVGSHFIGLSTNHIEACSMGD